MGTELESRKLADCLIETYKASVTTTFLAYKPGDLAVTDFRYTLTQTPDCGYLDEITIDKSADFVTHNADN